MVSFIDQESKTAGQTPLMYAVCAGHAACVEIILAYGANINQPSRGKNKTKRKKIFFSTRRTGGWSPLHWAVLSGHPSCARMLLDNGADYNQKNDCLCLGSWSQFFKLWKNNNSWLDTSPRRGL